MIKPYNLFDKLVQQALRYIFCRLECTAPLLLAVCGTGFRKLLDIAQKGMSGYPFYYFCFD